MTGNNQDIVQSIDAITRAITNPAGVTLTSSADYVGQATIGNLLIQWGRNTIASGGTAVTYPVPFAKVPVVQLTLQDPGFWDVTISAVGATSFTARQAYTTAPLWVHWMAIGYKV